MKNNELRMISLVSAALSYEYPPLLDQYDKPAPVATWNTYKADLRDFSAWCRGRNLSPLPAAPGTVAAYLAALALRCRTTKMQRRNASISQQHATAGYEPPSNTVTVRHIIRGVRRTLAALKLSGASVR